MADSIERIADEVATYQAPPNGQYIQVHPRVMRDWESRLRALSPAGGGEAKLLERARAAVRVLRTILHKGNLRTGAEVSEQLLADLENALAASPQQEPGASELCKTCGGHGVVCYHTGQTPEQYEEHTEDCPDCTPSGQTLAGAGGVLGEIDSLWSLMQEARVSYSGDHASGTFRICGDRLSKIRDSVAAITATSAGTTGDDSEDAARYRWLRTCGVADDRAIHTRGYSELLSESELDAAIDARRAREVGK